MPKLCSNPVCERSGEILPDEDFETIPATAKTKERLHSQCRRCRNKKRREYSNEAYKQNQQAAKDRVKKWRAKKKRLAKLNEWQKSQVIEQICEFCGEPYQRYFKSRFCSKKCNAEARQVGIALSSEARARISQHHLTTHRTGHIIDIVCDQCGETFQTYASKRPLPLKFCTRKCAGKHRSEQPRMKNVDIEKPRRRSKPNMTVVLENGELKNV